MLCVATILLATHALCNTQFSDVVRFASLDKAKALLTQEDDFTQSWSQFDIDARLNKQNGTRKELLDLIASQAREWTADEEKKMRSIIDGIDSLITKEGFNIDYPDEIWFVKTTATEEGGAVGYTRANYIVLKEAFIARPVPNLRHTIIHELFHVLTRNNPEFRKEMYDIIGFKVVNSIPYPESIKNFRITNPDAPQTDAVIKLQVNGEDVECMMVLYSKTHYTDGDFFKYLNVGFLRLTGNEIKKVLLVDDHPVIYEMKDVTNFFEQVGKNTSYTIHPEEILADNFAHAVIGRSGLANPEIVEKMKEKLKG